MCHQFLPIDLYIIDINQISFTDFIDLSIDNSILIFIDWLLQVQ